MSRIRPALALSLFSLCGACGCSHFLEARAIDTFAAALASENLDQLKDATSSHFESVALRDPEALQDLKILRIPNGETTVLKVNDVSDTEKEVFVEVAKQRGRTEKLRYRLVHDLETDKWVVDDIDMMKRRKNMTTIKPVSEQMDLLLAVRELNRAWHDGTPAEILAGTTKEFHDELHRLPPPYLTSLAQRVAGKRPKNGIRPLAQMDEDVAVVKLERAVGHLQLAMKRVDGRWKVDDIAVEVRAEDERLPSVRKQAKVVNTGIAFLNAYRGHDNAALKNFADGKFYDRVLRYAALASVELPDAADPKVEFEPNMYPDRANLIVRSGDRFVTIDMRARAGETADIPLAYLVDEVTIYDAHDDQRMLLSALVTSRAIMEIFADAIADRDLRALYANSTRDFVERGWRWFTPENLANVPLDAFSGSERQVEKTEFDGRMTKITVRAGHRRIVYDLVSVDGQIRVDDVHSDAPGLPGSLKQTIELLAPLQTIAFGIENDRLPLIQRSVSFDFNRDVWHQVRDVPSSSRIAARLLRAPVKSLERTHEQARIVLGDDSFGADVFLVNEGEHFVVDDIIARVDGRQARMKETLNRQIVEQFAIRSDHPQPPASDSFGNEPRVIDQVDFNEVPQPTPREAFPQQSPSRIPQP